MPLYEYKCEGCGDIFEIIQKFSDEPLAVHEKCGGAVHRLISRSALQFKGSGFYINDYAKGNGGAKKDSSDAQGAKDGTSKPAETKTETKSADTSSSTSSTSPKKSE